MLATSTLSARRGQSLDVSMAANGAFRDGLYLGRLDAGRGRPLHPAVGRWSTEKDRASFAAGYRRGYDDFLAGASPNQTRTQSE
jgi:hypothetical protein